MKSKNLPEISVFLTTFNRKKYLKVAINSVLEQSFKNFEFFILDNNSTDGTDRLVKNLKSKKINYIKHRNISISEQRNFALTLSKAKYIAFLDDDDVWLPNKLELQLKKFKESNNNVCLVYAGYCFYNDSGEVWGRHYPNLLGYVLIDLLWGNNNFTGSASNPLIDREKLIEVGSFNEKILAGEDWEAYLRLSEKFEISNIPDLILRIRQHQGLRLGGNINYSLLTEIKVFNKYKNIMPKKMISLYLQRIGGKFVRLERFHLGRKFLINAIVLNPSNILAYNQYLLSFFPSALYKFFHNFYIRCRRLN